MSKTGVFAMSALALELASELSGMADNLETIACSNYSAEETHSEMQYTIGSLGVLTIGYGERLNDLFKKHIRKTNIGA